MREPELTNVAIIGGGPAGASAALELGRLGISAIVVEQTDGGGNPIGECLAPTANPLLRSLGLHEIMQVSGAIPSYANQSSWGGTGVSADNNFLRNPFGHGWHLDRPAFNRALLESAERAGITVKRHHRITAFQRSDSVWRLTTTSPDGEGVIYAGTLVDASGRRAVVARREQARRRVFDSLVAAVAYLEADDRSIPLHDATTFIEACPDGWWYGALLPDRQLAVTWFTDPDLLAASRAWRPVAWWEQLRSTDLFEALVAPHGYRMPEHIYIRAAGSSVLAPSHGDGWIAVGDATAAHDPLSSHGIGSALASGKQAARAIAAHLGGDDTAFAAYEQRHLADYTRYLWMRAAYYADEQRWTLAPFWSRRQGHLNARGGHVRASTPYREASDVNDVEGSELMSCVQPAKGTRNDIGDQ